MFPRMFHGSTFYIMKYFSTLYTRTIATQKIENNFIIIAR